MTHPQELTGRDRPMFSARRTPWLAQVAAASGLLGALLFIPSGCSDDDDGGAVSAEDAPASVAKALCGDYYACACDAEDTTFSSQEDCELEVASGVQRAVDEGKAEGLTYDSSCVTNLNNLVSAVDCRKGSEIGFDKNLAELAQNYTRCKLFYGTKQPGTPCERLTSSNGDDCIQGSSCENSLCSELSVLREKGEACDDEDPCTAGLVCVSVNGDGERTCEVLPEVSQTCLGAADLCTTTAYCDQSTKQCRALPASGQCAPTANLALRRCAQGSQCNEDTCEPAPGGGEACVLDCAVGFTCDTGRCRAEESVSCGVTRLVGTL